MSLINDVLRDLDRRETTGNPEKPGLASATSALPWRPPALLWWLLSAAALGVLLHVVWRDLEETVVTPETAAPGIAFTPALEASPESRSTEDDEPADQIGPAQPDKKTTRRAVGKTTRTLAQATLPLTEQRMERQNDPPGVRNEEPSDEPMAPVILIERADSGAADQPLLAAQRALARGQADLARQHLENRLQLAAHDHEARLLLAQVHRQTGRPAAAAQVLDDGLESGLSPLIAAARARQLLEDQQPERARDLLLAHAPSGQTDADYQLLMAAAFRQTGQDEKARDIYLNLTASSPDRGQVWIGLGSTLETLQKPQAAREAYLRALQTNDRRAIVFARTRLAALPDNQDQHR